jgi:hypothetical protein
MEKAGIPVEKSGAGFTMRRAMIFHYRSYPTAKTAFKETVNL